MKGNRLSLKPMETSQNLWNAHSIQVFNVTVAEANGEEK